jgi:hypothetical protein
MSEENEKLKNNINENDEDISSDEEKKDNIENEKDNNEEIKNLLNKENKTTIKTSEVEDSLIINQKIQKLRNMKLDSDDLLKKKKYEEAINSYKNTINTLLEDFNDKMEIDTEVLGGLKYEIIIPCYQNISLCHMKLSNWLKMKTYSKKVLELDSENIKASYRLCLANIKLGHLKKADHQLEDLEKKIGGSPELEELEKIYSINKINAEGNYNELLKKMGKKLIGGKINMYSDKKTSINIEKANNENKLGFCGKIKRGIRYLLRCCKKKKLKKK